MSGVVRGPDGPFTLSLRERDLLSALAERPGEVVSRAALGGPGGSRAADMLLSRLRRRLGDAARRLVTVRGQGYCLDVESVDGGLDLGWGSIHLGRRSVTIRGRSVTLSEQQTRVLARLAASPGKPVPRGDLAVALSGRGTDLARLDLALHRLRQRLEANPAQPRYLVTLRGAGVVLLDARLGSSPLPAALPRADLLGRDDELHTTLRLLDKTPRRAVIHGPPGIGKSALAAAVARAWIKQRERRSHGLLDLHGVTEMRDVQGRLAATLGMDDVRDNEAVARSLNARGELVLLVDGALPDELAVRLTDWLGAAPQLRVLVAARDSADDFPLVELRGLPSESAIELLERAAGRSLADGGARVSRRVDGNPLALQLIGTGLQHASLDDYERRLALPLTPLRRAWRAVLEHLPADEHAVALASSLFQRPFEPGDLDAITGTDSRAVLDHLVARSILQRSPAGRLLLPHAAREILVVELRRDADGRSVRTRFVARCRARLWSLLESIPRVGGAALRDLEERWPDLRRGIDGDGAHPGDQEALLAGLARQAAERIPRERGSRWASTLTDAAAREDLPGEVRARCLQAVHALRWSEQSRTEREQLMRRALALADDAGADVVAASVAAELASVVAFSWGLAEARQILRAHPMPDDAAVDERIRHHRHVGRLGIYAGRPSVGLPRLRSGVALAEEAGLPLLEARCRIALGQALSVSTLGREAEFHLRRAIALTREHELPEQNVRASLRLAQHLLRLGLRPDAAELLDAALDSAVRAGLSRLEEQCASTLGYLMIGARRLEEALVLLDRSIALCGRHGGKRALFVSQANRGLALALLGRSDEARADLHAAMASSSGGGGWYGALALAYLAIAQLMGGDGPTSAASIDQARSLLNDLEHPQRSALDEALEKLRGLATSVLAPAAASAWAAGWEGGAEVEGVVMGVQACASVT